LDFIARAFGKHFIHAPRAFVSFQCHNAHQFTRSRRGRSHPNARGWPESRGRADDAEKKKGTVTHPHVLTQRTPVLRSGRSLSLLGALLGSALLGSTFGRLLRSALLCSCHKFASPFF